MLTICQDLGFIPSLFSPTGEGRDYKASPYLDLLAEHRERFTVFSGLSHPEVDGSHKSDPSFLTAAPLPGRLSFRNTISLDQVAADHIGHLTRFRSLCFFGWFGIAPLMAVVREDLNLTKEQIGNTIIASIAITVVSRLIVGWLCDKIGPRKAYTWLLVLGSIPVMTIGLADSYESFLLFRLAVGAIGASFVITQYHTSVMFAPNAVGTANATTAGLGNLGGGVTQMVMPLILAGVMTFVAGDALGWRIAMIISGIALLLTAFLYWKFTEDSPDGNYGALRASGEMESASKVNGASSR